METEWNPVVTATVDISFLASTLLMAGTCVSCKNVNETIGNRTFKPDLGTPWDVCRSDAATDHNLQIIPPCTLLPPPSSPHGQIEIDGTTISFPSMLCESQRTSFDAMQTQRPPRSQAVLHLRRAGLGRKTL